MARETLHDAQNISLTLKSDAHAVFVDAAGLQSVRKEIALHSKHAGAWRVPARVWCLQGLDLLYS